MRRAEARSYPHSHQVRPPIPTRSGPPAPTRSGSAPRLPPGQVPLLPPGQVPPFPPGQVPLLPPGQVPLFPPGGVPPLPPGQIPLLLPGQVRTLRPRFHHEAGSHPPWTRSPAPRQHQAARTLLLLPGPLPAPPAQNPRGRLVRQRKAGEFSGAAGGEAREPAGRAGQDRVRLELWLL